MMWRLAPCVLGTASGHFLMASDRAAADKHLSQFEQGEEVIVWEIPPQPTEVPRDVLNLQWEAQALAKYLWGVAHVMLYENKDMAEEAGVVRMAGGDSTITPTHQVEDPHELPRWQILDWFMRDPFATTASVRQLQNQTMADILIQNVTGAGFVAVGGNSPPPALTRVAREYSGSDISFFHVRGEVGSTTTVQFLREVGGSISVDEGHLTDDDLYSACKDLLHPRHRPIQQLNGVTRPPEDEIGAEDIKFDILILAPLSGRSDTNSLIRNTMLLGMKELTLEQNSSLRVRWMDPEIRPEYIEQTYSVPQQSLPTIVAIPRPSNGIDAVWFQGVPFAIEIIEWYKDLLSGALVPARHILSEAAPESPQNYTAQPMHKVVASTFYDGILNNTADVLLFVHTDWCKGCQRIEPAISEFASAIRFTNETDKLHITSMSVDENFWCKYVPASDDKTTIKDENGRPSQKPSMGMMEKICYPAVVPISSVQEFMIKTVPALYFIRKDAEHPRKPISLPAQQVARNPISLFNVVKTLTDTEFTLQMVMPEKNAASTAASSEKNETATEGETADLEKAKMDMDAKMNTGAAASIEL